jgi:hypothetical protein
MSADDRHPEPIDDESPLSETLLTYGAPFFGTLLVAVGIAGGTLGGYAVVQSQLNLCGSPTIVVYSPGATEQLTAATRTDPLREFGIEELSPAERRAFEDALENPRDTGEVNGRFIHRGAFRQGVLVTSGGTTRYATISSANPCLSVDPLLFPLGVVSILLGVLGILTPPLYRKLLEREERARGTNQ